MFVILMLLIKIKDSLKTVIYLTHFQACWMQFLIAICSTLHLLGCSIYFMLIGNLSTHRLFGYFLAFVFIMARFVLSPLYLLLYLSNLYEGAYYHCIPFSLAVALTSQWLIFVVVMLFVVFILYNAHLCRFLTAL